MPELPSLEMAKKMCDNFRYDDFTLWIIEGNLRIGKSANSMLNGFQVLEYFWGDPWKWESIKPFMGWHPAENVEKWLNVDERQPFFIWDDAGYWLFSLNWHDPVMVAIQKYMNVIATDYSNLILTTPSVKWILSKIAGMPGMRRVKIIKRSGGRMGRNKRSVDSEMWRRLAICYEPWTSPDLKSHGVYKKFYDTFRCKIPDDVYKVYYPIRKEYATLAKMKIKEELKLRSTLSRVEQLRYKARLRQLENEEVKIQSALKKELAKEGINYDDNQEPDPLNL